jgi:uncharacterized protein (DUF1015 family)
MARIFPFRALHFDSKHTEETTEASVPQSRIDSEEIARLTEDGTVVRDRSAGLYACYIRFQRDGETLTRKGLVALVELKPLGSAVRACEKQSREKTEYSLDYLLSNHFQFAEIAVLYADPSFRINRTLDAEISGRDPQMELTDRDGSVHQLWKIDRGDAVKRLVRTLEDKPITIAAGRHAYEASLAYYETMRSNYAREIGDESIRNVLTVLFNVDQPSLADVRDAVQKGDRDQNEFSLALIPSMVMNRISTE